MAALKLDVTYESAVTGISCYHISRCDLYTDTNVSDEHAVSIFRGRRQRQNVCPKRWYRPANPQGTKTQDNNNKNVTFCLQIEYQPTDGADTAVS
jgi:hypothetical protein